ncbi:MAG: hypothetical protein HY321_01670 [Armatimonadetes bacterium]|nr:hypothetical protein [Armatimonadota bacterium]
MGVRAHAAKSGRFWQDGLCAALWLAALAALVGAAGWGLARAGWRRPPIPTMRQVVVPRGGTLWGVAATCAAPGQDPRAVAREIRRINGLGPGRVLHPGARLLVPDYRAGAARLAHRPQDES